MKTLLLTILFVLGSSVIGYSQSQKELLDQAYEEQSIAKLGQFFHTWSNEIKPISTIVQDDTLREVYQLFKDIYRPMELSELKSKELGAYFYQFANYYIVQGYFPNLGMVDKIYTQREIATLVIDELRKKNITDTAVIKKKVMDMRENFEFINYQPTKAPTPISRTKTWNVPFHPEVITGSRKAVYLSNEYRAILMDFLGNDPTSAGQISADRRQSFLAIMAVVLRAKSNNNWMIATFPHIYAVHFDKSLKRARIIYRVGQETGSAVVVKEGNSWHLDFVEILRTF